MIVLMKDANIIMGLDTTTNTVANVTNIVALASKIYLAVMKFWLD